ncbi:acyl-CoA-binding protein, putative [Plasmodium ovale]|uniref:Acyl-CoA-binding protein, putative n=1 Tax=Plasmodium ovale TaxID=36330 RepID=A0A1C3KSG1_PLAOA|nr:acyl-CoA-binding protein, putative [Plasmodium ovale]
MLKSFNKPLLFANAASVLVILFLLHNYGRGKSEDRNNRNNGNNRCRKGDSNWSIKEVLGKMYEAAEGLISSPIEFFRKYQKLKLPPIDKNVTINLTEEELEEKFTQTCNAVKMFRGKMKVEQWMYLYGLYKQITAGDMQLSEDSNEKANDSNIGKSTSKKQEKTKDDKSNSFMQSEKMIAWKNCYGVNKKVCKFLYVKFFNELFPQALENMNNNFSFDISKGVSKMKSFKENNNYEKDTIHESSNNLCDILCRNVVSANLDDIKKALKNYPYLINKKNTDGLTALHYACDRGYLEIVKFLVNQGADINVEDSYGDTAIHIAAYSEKSDIINYLTSIGADLNRKNADGLTVNSILHQT